MNFETREYFLIIEQVVADVRDVLDSPGYPRAIPSPIASSKESW